MNLTRKLVDDLQNKCCEFARSLHSKPDSNDDEMNVIRPVLNQQLLIRIMVANIVDISECISKKECRLM